MLYKQEKKMFIINGEERNFLCTFVRTISCGKLVMAFVSQPSRLLAKFRMA